MHRWQPFQTPHGQPNAVPQHQCTKCGVCRTYPDPTAPKEAQYWYLAPFGGAASTEPTDERPPCINEQ